MDSSKLDGRWKTDVETVSTELRGSGVWRHAGAVLPWRFFVARVTGAGSEVGMLTVPSSVSAGDLVECARCKMKLITMLLWWCNKFKDSDRLRRCCQG